MKYGDNGTAVFSAANSKFYYSPLTMSDTNTSHTAVVIDNGTHATRVGFAGADTPNAVFPTIVARPPGQYLKPGSNSDLETCRVGLQAKPKKGALNAKWPVEYGIVTNWDDMELLWHHAFKNELHVDPKDHPVLLTEPPLNPKANREKMTQLMFETFHTPAMYAACQAVLSLYYTGRTTGLVVDCGQGQGLSVPIYEGYALRHAIMKLPCAGYDLTYLLMRLLNESNGSIFTSLADKDVVSDIKETLCSVALDLDLQLMVTPTVYEKKYVLPDGKSITVGKERFVTPEAMFQPSFLGYESSQGVHDAVGYSIKKCDAELTGDLSSNIVLSGGSTKFPGFEKRLEKEVTLLALEGSPNVKVTPTSESGCSAWLGGSVLAGLPQFKEMWVSKEDYDECGPAIVHRKCF